MVIAAKLLVFFIVTALAIWTPQSNSKVLGDGGKISVHETELYFQNEASYGQGSLRSYQCPFQCNRRCSQTQYRKPCLFFCNQCCSKCLCVPPGFYGNKGVCPCYNNWKTKRGGPKCP